MIELAFVMGGNIRKVYIKKDEVIFLTPEFKYQPFPIRLDGSDKSIEESLDMMKNLTDKERKDMGESLKRLSKLKDEEEIAKDIKKDFQRSGWRLFKKE